MSMLAMWRAAAAGERFLRDSRAPNGGYQISWPVLGPSGRRAVDATRAVTAVRTISRARRGFPGAVDDALFLTAALRQLGLPVVFCLGRQLAPSSPPAGFWAWVEADREVLSTSLAVHEEYVVVYRNQPGDA